MNSKGLKLKWQQDRWLVISVIVILLLRLFFIGAMGLMPQDAYYHFYSQHPALSYYDHPPAIAWVLRLFTTLFGKHVYTIKLADSIITLFTIISFYYFARCFLSRHRTQRALLMLFSTLMVTILSLVSTPDTPLVLCWTLSLLALYHALFLHKKTYWLLAGICMGLAFDSKYTAVFLPAGLLLFLLLSSTHRRYLLTAWPWLAMLLFALTISPVIIWNVENNFASFAFQSASRIDNIDRKTFSLTNFLGVIGHQSFILIPILFFALLVFLYKIIKKYKARLLRIPARQLFLLCFFIPLFGCFFCLSFVYWVKLNWMMPSYIAGIVLLSIYIRERWIRLQLIVSLTLHLLLAIEVLFYPIVVKSDDTWEGWESLQEQVRSLHQHYPGAFIFSADDYKTSAVLNFYLDEMVYGKNVIGERALQFDYIGTDLRLLKGKDALFIDSRPRDFNKDRSNEVLPALNGYFDTIEELSPIIIMKNNRIIRKFLVYHCTNYNYHL